MSKPVSNETAPSGLERLISRYVRETRGSLAFGPLAEFRVSVFVDLLSAAHDESCLSFMTQELSRIIESRAENASDSFRYDLVATPKRGNVLLGREVARAVQKPSLFARDEIIFQRWIEGEARGNQRAIIVDDVASDGHLLAEAIASLRREGIYVSDVFVLIHRTEGDAEEKVEGLGVRFHKVISLDDRELRRIRLEVRAHEPLGAHSN